MPECLLWTSLWQPAATVPWRSTSRKTGAPSKPRGARTCSCFRPIPPKISAICVKWPSRLRPGRLPADRSPSRRNSACNGTIGRRVAYHLLSRSAMRSMHLAFPVAAIGLCLTACDVVDWGGMERFSRDFHYSYALASDGRISVETFNGGVEISGWDQNTVDISGTKYGPTQDAADDLKVNVDNSRDSVSIRVSRPSERRNNQGARFVIKIPRTAYIDRITTSNGEIRTTDGAGPARLRTSNGAIRVSGLRGSLDAVSSNGPVELLDVDGDVVAHT